MKKIISLACILLAIVITTSPYVYAAENTFQTTLGIIANDVANPTVPTNLAASVISSSQINLAWDASTDDVAVVGYRIFRDGSIIASTTSLYYSDTGLTASTTYIYSVEAFDAVPKYSGQSSLISATTTAFVVVIPPVNPTTPTQSSAYSSNAGSQVLIGDLRITQALDSTIISYMTSEFAQAKVYWGLTNDYEIGSISELLYTSNHSVKIETLNSHATYFFKIEIVTVGGKKQIIESSFQTKNNVEGSVLTNVSNFKASPLEKSITLNWTNPSSLTFDSVRLVRSDKFFPRDVFDGETIYEGKVNSFVDSHVEIGTTYYYAIFAKDSNGEYSSGALTQARIGIHGESEVQTNSDPFANISVLRNVDPLIANLALSGFDFMQSGIKLINIGNSIVIDGSKNLVISLEYEKVPEILKTIAITLIDPDDSTKVFPFLLRVNKDKTAYEATLAPLGKSGVYQMKIIVLDYKNQGLKRLEGSLKALLFNQLNNLRNKGILRKDILAIVLVGLIILCVFVVLYRKRNESIN